MVPHDNQGRSRQMTKETHSALLTKLEALTSLPRSVRRWLVFGFDGLLCLVAAWIALALRLGEWPNNLRAVLILTATALFFWAAIAWPAGVYRNLIRFSGARASGRLFYACALLAIRSEEHTSELQPLMRISYAVFCLKKKKTM